MGPRIESMFIRYFAQTDDSQPIGVTARTWLDAMVEIPINGIRVLPTGQQGFMGKWAQRSNLGITAIDGPYINVVCCPPQRWAWHLAIRIPTKAGGAETMEDDVELYTSGVRNILIVPRGIYPKTKLEVLTAIKYEAMIVGSEDDAIWWRGVGSKPHMLALPVGLRRQAAIVELQKVLFPGES